ncbi:hypothetical protein SAMN05519104_1488 [Rhizobiales bacterium GAS188]|nr:hypothetical protein SAMN05519104_1488 [Rhizobiales bacterium GAS188]
MTIQFHLQAGCGPTARIGPSAIERSLHGDRQTVFLLCGLASENAIKVFLVYENPSWRP